MLNFEKLNQQSYSSNTVGFEVVILNRKGQKFPLFVNQNANKGFWINDETLSQIVNDYNYLLIDGDELQVLSYKDRGYIPNLFESIPDCNWSVTMKIDNFSDINYLHQQIQDTLNNNNREKDS